VAAEEHDGDENREDSTAAHGSRTQVAAAILQYPLVLRSKCITLAAVGGVKVSIGARSLGLDGVATARVESRDLSAELR
jgi:hypothetical protein